MSEDTMEVTKDSEIAEEKNEAAATTAIPTLDLDIYTPYIDASVERYKKAKKVKKIVLASIGGFVLFVYVLGVIYHSICFGRLTTLNGYDVSMKNAGSVEAIINRDMNNYQLEVEYINENHTITFDDGVFSVRTAKPIKQLIREQQPLLWFINIWQPKEITVEYVTTVDDAALSELLMSYDCYQKENMEEPEDAYVSMDGGEAHIVPETKGSILDIEKSIAFVSESLTNMDEKLVIEDMDCYEKASVCENSDKLVISLQDAEDYLAVDMVYNFKGYEVPVSKEEMASMAYIGKDGKVTVDESKVKKFVQDFSDKYSTCYTDRKFKTNDKKMILVYGGYYGWQLNPEEEEPLLYEALVNREGFNRQFSCEKEGYTYCDLNDIGDNYVEIDLTDQHVYVYENGRKVYDTPCVSGNVSWGMSTPGGLYPLTYKQRNATLNGPGYSTPVAYWMPFNGDIGMHDATWKTKFGEDYYMYDGSHGCINLPLDAAASIYPYVEAGSPVVCYWEDEVEYIDED